MQARDLVGVWMVQTFDLEDPRTGDRSRPWGDEPRGTLVFHPDGRMFAIIHANPRLPPETDLDQAAAFQKMLAYSGHYRVEPLDRLVTTVDIAWFEPWIGSEQVRYCELAGDDLVLRSAPLDMPREEAAIFAVVRWKRETAKPAR